MYISRKMETHVHWKLSWQDFYFVQINLRVVNLEHTNRKKVGYIAGFEF